LVALLVFIIFPLVWVFMMSFKGPNDLVANPPRFVFRPIIENYAAVLQLDMDYSKLGIYTAASVDFLAGYRNSLVICIGALAMSLLLGLPSAYALARFEFRFKEHLAFGFLGMRFVPDLALVIPLYILFRQLHLYDTKLGLMISYQSFMLPFIIWTMRGYFQEVPKELEEAAALDGCSFLGTFRRIVLPLTAPGLAATAALAFIFAWNNFGFGLMLTQVNAQPVTVKMLGYITYTATLWGQLAAAGVIIIAPQLLVGVFIQRYIVRGLTYGMQ